MRKKDKRFCIQFIDEVLEEILVELRVCGKIKKIVLNTFEEKIFENCFKEFVYCLNLSRINGELIGESPEERFQYFDNTDFGILKIKETFGDLKTSLKKEFLFKIQYIVNVIEEYEAQKKDLAEKFFENQIVEIVNLNCGGDWHDNKCVVIIELENSQKIVYKPTSGENIKFFQKVISKFFDENDYIKLYDSSIATNGYWCRFVEHTENKEDVADFYRNYGKVLFISYLLGMNDLHYENMIAQGRFPVISDVETIFSTYVYTDTKKYYYEAHKKAVSVLSRGTMSTGLLPVLSMVDYFGGDVSCLSNRGMKVKVQKLKNTGRDDMSIYDEYEIVKSNLHLPYQEIDPLDFGNEILEGFIEAEKLWNHKKTEIEQVVMEDGKRVETRIILAMSKAYAKICKMKNEVIYRDSYEKYEALIEKLKSFGEYDEVRFQYERSELLNGNIPCYYWNESSSHIYTHLNEERIEIAAESTLNLRDIWMIMQQQIQSPDILRQEQYVRDTIKTCKAMLAKPNEKLLLQNNKQQNHIQMRPIIEEYKKIVENIENQIVEGSDDTVEWIGLTVAEQDQLAYQIMDDGIYKGNSGLGILFLQYYRNQPNKKIMSILDRMVHTFSLKESIGLYDSREISYYNGLTGIYHFLCMYGYNFHNQEAITLKEKVEKHILQNIALTTLYDNVGGLLSTIIYFYALYKEKKDAFAKLVLDKVKKRYLVEYDIQYVKENLNFASFAHGFEAHLTAALCLYAYSKDYRLLDIIQELYELQNNLEINEFSWRDTRKCDKLQVVHFWCHGSCGIMFSRLIWKKLELTSSQEIERIFEDYDLDESLNRYMTRILEEKFEGVNYSLCHGNMALIDFLISYHRIYNRPFGHKVKNYINKVIDNAVKNNLSCLTPGAINSISFMVGEAGIAYTFQRIHSKLDTSILALGIL